MFAVHSNRAQDSPQRAPSASCSGSAFASMSAPGTVPFSQPSTSSSLGFGFGLAASSPAHAPSTSWGQASTSAAGTAQWRTPSTSVNFPTTAWPSTPRVTASPTPSTSNPRRRRRSETPTNDEFDTAMDIGASPSSTTAGYGNRSVSVKKVKREIKGLRGPPAASSGDSTHGRKTKSASPEAATESVDVGKVLGMLPVLHIWVIRGL